MGVNNLWPTSILALDQLHALAQTLMGPTVRSAAANSSSSTFWVADPSGTTIVYLELCVACLATFLLLHLRGQQHLKQLREVLVLADT